MATQENPTSQYDTALCLIPPKHLWPLVDRLRSVYDPAYKKWPPHINLIYPFVPIENLRSASETVISNLRKWNRVNQLDLRLDSADYFDNEGKKATFFIYDKDPDRWAELLHLRRIILEALEHESKDSQLHMTIGQSKNLVNPPNNYILQKVKMIPTLRWKVDKICILIRNRDEARTDQSLSSQMKIWGEVDLEPLKLTLMRNPVGFYDNEMMANSDDELNAIPESQMPARLPYTFSPTEYKWIPQHITQQGDSAPESLTIASYNIRAEFRYPPTRARYPIIIQNLLDRRAMADVLVLQEVTDDFLSHLCRDERIRKNYPYISDGPAEQPDIEPLSDHSNIVVLSKWSFSWNLLLLPTPKASVIVQFSNIGKHESGVFLPVILSAIHFTSGLTDESVEKKKEELESILKYLHKMYPDNPWILAGDFNIATSVYAIETAVKEGYISTASKNTLGRLETMLTEAGLVDTWTSACVQYGDLSRLDQTQQDTSRALGGEQGATFDPTINQLAADIGRGDVHGRPQRYDRILVRRKNYLTVTGFNMFGQVAGTLQTELDGDIKSDDSDVRISHGSDHWGIRCSLKVFNDTVVQPPGDNLISPVELRPAPPPIASISELTACLSKQSIHPSETDIVERESALNLLKETIVQGDDSTTQGLPAFVMIPVGSYGLGVWTTSSNIDCLCIGPISSKTFFTLAIQRLRKAASRGVKVLRHVGIDTDADTMLKVEVGHIKIYLQYCSAVTIAETWPAVLTRPPTDPMFNLPSDVLAKLKPMRDLHHLQQTVPDLAAFKLAYQFVVCWAKRRGIYASKFGYFGGIQISILLSRVCKLLCHEGRSVSVPTILTSFYSHYAGFDWEKHIVFDPFFHKRLSYVRTTREPMGILGFHGPRINTAQAASISTVRAISNEFKRADALLSEPGMTWSHFLGRDTDVNEFLRAYKLYIRITAKFWGVSLAKGNSFVDWLESRCTLLFNDLNKQVPQLNPRIWPARFVGQDSFEDDVEYEGYYLIGLEIKDFQGKPTTKEEVKTTLAHVQAALRKFETQITDDTKYFDPNSCWVSAETTPQSELGELQVSNRDWGKYTLEAEDDDLGDLDLWTSTEPEEPRKPRAKKGSTNNLVHRPAEGKKLRSAADVLNRLRWDPAIDGADYIVVYEDRFSGTMERSVKSWKSDTTHEEFIPEHRITSFKRKSDGAIVWDRVEKRDEIFGSGVTSLRG